MAKEIKLCPSCGGSDITKDGKLLYCQTCDVTFEITDRGARVRDADPLKEDRQRLTRIESDLAEIKKRLGPGAAEPPAEPGDADDSDDQGDANGDEGFVVLGTE